MNIFFLLPIFFTASLVSAVASAIEATPASVVQTMEQGSGPHPGYRKNHAKGICATGEFTASAEAKTLSRSLIFQGAKVPVVARFSMAGGVPEIPDTAHAPRGFALQFQPKDGVHHNMAMLSTPVFAVKTPEAFHEFLLASAADPKTGKPDGEKMKAFIGAHPEIGPFLAFVTQNNPAASYASSPYYSLHAFKFSNAKKKDQFVRWRFEPSGGKVLMKDEELSHADANYLETELKERVKSGKSLEWTMIAMLAGPKDSLVDPTQSWPADRKEVKMGTLKLTQVQDQKGGPCEDLNFDPNQLTDGVAASEDPILKFRTPAYAISYGKRMSEKTSSGPKAASEHP